MTEKRGSLGFASTYRPPLPLDLFSCTVSKQDDEVYMSDGVSYNYNGRNIPPLALKTIIKRPIFTTYNYTDNEVDSGGLAGMVLVSERSSGLETLHIGLRRLHEKTKVFSLADVFGTFSGVRMEDSGSIAARGGDYIVYVTTKDPATTNDGAPARRQPWTAVYKTKLTTGETTRLTPIGQADLSPSVHPSGTKIALASFEGKEGGWYGEIEDLQTNIYVMNIDQAPFKRTLVVKNGGWPTWGSDNVLFFHSKVLVVNPQNKDDHSKDFWAVFRVYMNDDGSVSSPASRVTPDGISAMTPAAIDDTTVAVATIRKKSSFSDIRTEAQYRHIEIFRCNNSNTPPTQITQKIRPLADHFNPFVFYGEDRVGYHRCKTDNELKGSRGDAQKHSNKLASPRTDVGVFRVPGIFPTFSKDGKMLAFVDNEFKNVWLADSKGLRIVYKNKVAGHIFSPVWNQNPEKDTLYVNFGPAFSAKERLDIIAIPKVSEGEGHSQQLTKNFNNAFPCTNPQGTKLVFRSTLNGGDEKHKNLYIMNDVRKGEYGHDSITRLTNGEWTDTHCQWSPNGKWIVFSSTRDKPTDKLDESDNGLDPGYFGVYLVNPDDPDAWVRVTASGFDGAGHVNHPFFSPDGMSIVVASDLAGVSADPISLPLFVHSVRPYGDIFIIDIDPHDINNNKNVKTFHRITHSRYENSTSTWTTFSTEDQNAGWNQLLNLAFTPMCPVKHASTGGETWYMSGHLCIPRRCC